MIPNTMKAWMLTEFGRLELQEIPVPEITEEQVLVKIDRACLCNGSDPGIFHGHEAYDPPLVFGHEASGSIVKKGARVTEFEVGDRICWWFEAGAFAEYQAVTPGNVAAFPVPEHVTRDQAPVMELVLAACRALMVLPPEEGRRTITICGLGPSGLVLTQYAKALGYERVIGWDLYEERRILGQKLGADLVYDPEKLVREGVSCIPESDLAVCMMSDDLLPGEPTFDLLMRTVRRGGTLVSYGHPERGLRFSPYVFQDRSLCMQGPVNDRSIIREKGREVCEMVNDGRIQIEPLITDRVDFEEFLPAFQRLLDHPEEQIKVILKWRESE